MKFLNPSFDPSRFHRDMHLVGARKSYVIHFTARSGSSWLTDLIVSTGRLGKPGEWFNTNFVPKIAQGVNANDIPSMIKMLKRKHAPGGIFGAEITYGQLIATFGSHSAFLECFPATTKSFFLVREDVVAQAVSLAKAVKTNLFHSRSSAEVAESEDGFGYDPAEISKWLHHLWSHERGSEEFFASVGIRPIRLSYEQLITADPNDVLRMFSQALGETWDGVATPPSRVKTGTAQNAEFAERFRKERAALVEEIESARAATIEALRQNILSLPESAVLIENQIRL